MAKVVHQVQHVPISGYDITNAFGLAMQGMNQAGNAMKDWLQTESDIATGQAMNALAQAEDPDQVRAILQEAKDNSWVDNKALGDSASKRKDRFFDENISEQELAEKLRAGEHSRAMAEESKKIAWANHALNAASTRASIAASNRSSRLSDLQYEIASTKWDAEKPYVEEDAFRVREAVRLKNAQTAGALEGNPKGKTEEKDTRPNFKTASKANIENAEATELSVKQVREVMKNGELTNEQKSKKIFDITDPLAETIGADKESTFSAMVNEGINYGREIKEKASIGDKNTNSGILKYSSVNKGEANAKRASEWKNTMLPFEIVASEMPELNIESGTFTTAFLNTDSTRPPADDMILVSKVFLEAMNDLKNDPLFIADMEKHMSPKMKFNPMKFGGDPIGTVFNSRKDLELMFNKWVKQSRYGTIVKKSPQR